MPNPNNVSKQIESTSPNTESVNATLVKNTVNTQLNGVSPSSQNYSPSSLGSSDYSPLSQAQQQSNYFISQSDKLNYKINPELTTYNPNPIQQFDVGIPYNYASDMAADAKYQRVTTDYKIKQDTSLPNKWGELAVSDNIETIRREAPSIESVLTLYRDANNWGLHGSSLKDRDDFNTNWCVTIEEDRESINRISSEGEFGTDRICVRVYQRVTTFSFGTTQSFQSISPRGSQTPLRFYENNPGRTLSFSAEFHQQEFPLQPLMSIAEKLQYLARTYKHGDYSLIPKMVRITIPGRTFRGYITNVGITYQGEDYTSWNKEEIKSALTKDVVNSWSKTYRGFRQMAEDQGFLPESSELTWDNHYTGKYGYTYDGNLNSGDAVNYGMERMTASIELAIVEEIKLTQYTTFREQQAQYIMDNQERAAEIQQAVISSWSDEYKRVGELLPNLVDAGGNPLTDENGKPYNTYDIRDLIYVDSATGEIQALHAWDGTPDQNMMTLNEFMKKQEVKKLNPKPAATEILPTDVMDKYNKTFYKEDMIDELVANKKNQNPSMTREELESYRKSLVQSSAEDVEREFKSLMLSETQTDGYTYLVDTSSKTYTTVQYGQTETVSGIEFPPDLLKFLKFNITSLKDVVYLLHFLGIASMKMSESHIRYSEVGVSGKVVTKEILLDCCLSDQLNLDLSSWGIVKPDSILDDMSKDIEIHFDNIDESKLSSKYKEHCKQVLKKDVYEFGDLSRISSKEINDLVIHVDDKENTINDNTIEKFFVSMFTFIKNNFPDGFMYESKKVTEGKKLYPTEKQAKNDEGSWYWTYVDKKMNY